MKERTFITLMFIGLIACLFASFWLSNFASCKMFEFANTSVPARCIKELAE